MLICHIPLMSYIARYVSTKVYTAKCKEELSIGTKEFVWVLNKRDSWVNVEVIRSGTKGLVPDKCIAKYRPMDESE